MTNDMIWLENTHLIRPLLSTVIGKNLLDGRYSCFGYTVKNADLLKGVREGDIIKSAKVVEGKDNLIPGKAAEV